jgi:hypothetical protein
MAQERTATAGPDRFLLGIVAGAGLLLVVSVIVVVVMMRRSPVTIDPSSPSGVVQAYAEAMRAGDRTRAFGYLTPEARATAIARNWSTSTPGYDDSVRIVVEPISEDASTATVRVSVTRFYARSQPFFGSSTTHTDRTVHLVRQDGAWLIDEALEPYAFV